MFDRVLNALPDADIHFFTNFEATHLYAKECAVIRHEDFFFFANPGVYLSVNIVINSINIITNYKVISLDTLILFRMAKNPPPYQIFLCNFFKRKNWPPKLSDF